MDDYADVKISAVSSLTGWQRSPGRPRIRWMKTVLDDLKSYKLTLTEALNWPFWRLLATFGATKSCGAARNDDYD